MKKIEKVTEFKYLGQTTHLKGTTKEEFYARIRAAWSCFGRKWNTPGSEQRGAVLEENNGIPQDRQLPIRQVMFCQQWPMAVKNGLSLHN